MARKRRRERGPAAAPAARARAFPAPSARLLGGVALLLLVALGVAGVVLALVYEAAPEAAHDAVARIVARPLLGFVRSFHAWAASAALVVALLAGARAYVSGGLSAWPRRARLAALGALAVLVAAFATGSVLRWDHAAWESYEHVRMGARLFAVPLPGAPEAAPLPAFFLVHVLAVPVVLAAALVVLVARRPGAAARLRVALVEAAPAATVLLVAVAALALVRPAAFGPPPLPGVVVARPEWPFLWLVPLQDAFGAPALLALPLAFVLVAFALVRPAASRRARAWGVGLATGLLAVLTVLALR
ncbi:MAG TPA: hypothetical protein VI997_04955 [Candidatus Thermoplasmatota archaeon]|nr:hypothetical protein [Candidatus Thermoplasmatota archaeon]